MEKGIGGFKSWFLIYGYIVFNEITITSNSIINPMMFMWRMKDLRANVSSTIFEPVYLNCLQRFVHILNYAQRNFRTRNSQIELHDVSVRRTNSKINLQNIPQMNQDHPENENPDINDISSCTANILGSLARNCETFHESPLRDIGIVLVHRNAIKKQDSLSEQNIIDQDCLSEQNIVDQDSLSEQNVIDQDSLSEQNIIDQDCLSEQIIIDQDSLSEQNIFDQDCLSEQNIIDQDSLSEQNTQNIIDQDSLSEQNIIDQDSLSEQNIIDQDSLSEQNIIDQDCLSEQNIIDQDCLSEQNIIDQDCLSEQNIIDKDCLSEQSIIDQDF